MNQPNPMSHYEDGVENRLARSDRNVLQIAVVTWLASRFPFRVFRQSTTLAAVCIGCVPVLGSAVETARGGDVGWFVWTTATIYGLLIVLMLLGAVRYWTRVVALGPDIDSILGKADRMSLSRWLGYALDRRPQAIFFVFGVATSTWVGFQLSGPLGGYAGNAGLAYTLTVGLTGGVGALTVYWLWGAPTLLFPLSRIEDPELDWVAPLQTPAVQAASRLMIDSSRLAAAGLVLFTIPIAMTLALASGHWSVRILSISSVVFSLITVLCCSFLPQIALESLVRHGKTHTLRKIRPNLPELADVIERPTPDAVACVELYERLSGSPVGVVDWKRLLEYFLLLLSSIVPIAIALLSR